MISSLIQNQSLSTELLYDYKSILDYEKVIKRIFYAEDKNYNNYKTVYHIGMNREAKKWSIIIRIIKPGQNYW